MPEIPLLPDEEAAIGILRDAEAAEAKAQALAEQSFAEWRRTNDELRKVLAALPARPFRR